MDSSSLVKVTYEIKFILLICMYTYHHIILTLLDRNDLVFPFENLRFVDLLLDLVFELT